MKIDENYFYGGDSAALNLINHALKEAKIIRISTAYFESSGFKTLKDIFDGKEVRLLVGRAQGGKDNIENIISEFIDSLSSGGWISRTAAMRELRKKLEEKRLSLCAETSPAAWNFKYQFQHAKLYMADKSSAVVTSANLSLHGLCFSKEAGILVTDKEAVRFFVEKFEEYFMKARPIGEELLDRLRKWLDFRMPFEVYARALLELYDLPFESENIKLPELAGYQKPVAARAIENFKDFNGCMLVASTGLGKTVMAGHIAAILREKGEIDNVIVFSPAGLREMWRRTLRGSRTSSEEFSYSTLSADDPARDRKLRILLHELQNVNENTLIILDESHNLRNEELSAGNMRLRNQRLVDAMNRRAKILLMTATPFSKNVDDINAQLRILPKSSKHNLSERFFSEDMAWHINRISDLSELPISVVLTAPTVVHKFSHKDENNQKYVLFSGDQKRYFPAKIHLHNIEYDNIFEKFLEEMLERSLLRVTDNVSENFQEKLFNDDNELSGKRMPFFEAGVLPRICSSPAEISHLFSKLETEGGFERMRFQYQKELTSFVKDKKNFLQPYAAYEKVDAKLQSLIDIIIENPEEKIVVFCVYRQSAYFLSEALKAKIRNLTVETTAGKDSEQLEKILRNFAPIANEVHETWEDEREDNIRVLIATGALAEGFNMQDASILVNYDMPWTVLVLAQRMGRIMRPWPKPREIKIFNLIPRTMRNENLHIARNWHNRLIERSRDLRSFAQIPILIEKRTGKDEFEMAELARTLSDLGSIDLELEEALKFIENAENIRTSSFLDDLALIEEKARKEILSLPMGFRTVRKTKKDPALFMLFSYEDKKFPALFNAKGVYDLNKRIADEIMNYIQCSPDTPLAPTSEYPSDEDFDLWIEKSRQNFLEYTGFPEEEVKIICIAAMVQGAV
ncbi:MAG: helicase-related protein [Spirochaetia bacterium]|nr:helicase-related protein [Spirochaetia bacterium]